MRRLTRGPILIAAILVLLVASAGSAHADDAIPVATCPGGVCLSAEAPGHPGSAREVGGTASSAGSVTCAYSPVSATEAAQLDQVSPHLNQSGGWFFRPCQAGSGPVWLPIGPTRSVQHPVIDLAVLAQQAYRILPIPSPRLATNPPASRLQLVHVPTWLWVDQTTWGTRTATVSVPGESVTATAIPTNVTWSMGDGRTVVCDGPSTPYDPHLSPTAQYSACTYTYERGSAGMSGDRYKVSATVTWLVSWTATGIASSGGQLPPLQRTSLITLAVGEAEALN
jgi:hypothetical protein